MAGTDSDDERGIKINVLEMGILTDNLPNIFATPMIMDVHGYLANIMRIKKYVAVLCCKFSFFQLVA